MIRLIALLAATLLALAGASAGAVGSFAVLAVVVACFGLTVSLLNDLLRLN
jgi:hypothetical protein